MHSVPGHAQQGCTTLMLCVLPANSMYFCAWKPRLMLEQP